MFRGGQDGPGESGVTTIPVSQSKFTGQVVSLGLGEWVYFSFDLLEAPPPTGFALTLTRTGSGADPMMLLKANERPSRLSEG